MCEIRRSERNHDGRDTDIIRSERDRDRWDTSSNRSQRYHERDADINRSQRYHDRSDTGINYICRAATILVLSLVALFVVLMLGLVGWNWQRSQLPFSNLESFSRTEAVGRELQDVKELPVDELKQFAQASCVQADSVTAVRSVLRAQLIDIPGPVRDYLVEAAVIEGASFTNSLQNTTAGVGNDGRAQHFIAFWSTQYAGAHPLGVSRYSTCVVVAGISMNIGEQVAEWRTTRTRRLLAHTPCNCGYVYCMECPIFNDDETRTPIFKRHKLTLNQHVQLNKWMVLQAVERARSLTATRKSVISTLFSNSKNDRKLPGTGMMAINKDTFHGRDEKSGRSGEGNEKEEL